MYTFSPKQKGVLTCITVKAEIFKEGWDDDDDGRSYVSIDYLSTAWMEVTRCRE